MFYTWSGVPMSYLQPLGLGMAMRQFLAMRYRSASYASNSKKIPNFNPFRVILTLVFQFPKAIDHTYDIFLTAKTSK